MEQRLEECHNEGKLDYHKGIHKNRYKENTNESAAWSTGYGLAEKETKEQCKKDIIKDVALSGDKQKAIKAFSEMVAKDCAEHIETLIEMRMNIYATRLAEIMQEDD